MIVSVPAVTMIVWPSWLVEPLVIVAFAEKTSPATTVKAVDVSPMLFAKSYARARSAIVEPSAAFAGIV